MKKIKEWFKKKETQIDLLIITSFLTIIGTTMALNIYVGLYLLAFVLLALAFYITRYK